MHIHAVSIEYLSLNLAKGLFIAVYKMDWIYWKQRGLHPTINGNLTNFAICIYQNYIHKKSEEFMNTAKIFQNGNSQAVRLPKEFQFNTSEVQILRRGDEVILKKSPQNLARVFELLTGLSDDFMENGRQ
jgi:antitoxin VapB